MTFTFVFVFVIIYAIGSFLYCLIDNLSGDIRMYT
jgi:hypothetical protein